MRRNLRPISGRNTAHLVIKIPTDWANPGGTTTPTAHIATTTDGQGAPAGPFSRYIQSSQPILSCFACFANVVRTQKQSKDSSRSEKETASRMFRDMSQSTTASIFDTKKKQLQKKVWYKKSRTNERTHAYIPRFLVLESKTRLSRARWLLASAASNIHHPLIL